MKMSRRLRVLAAVGAVAAAFGVATAAWVGWPRVPAPPPEIAAVEPEPAPSAPPAERRERVEVRRGDTLVGALRRAGIDPRTGHEITAALRASGADPRRVRPRDPVEIAWSPEGDPTAVVWQPSPWLGYAVVAREGRWAVERLETTPDVRVEAVKGRVERSLFQAVDEIGESAQLVLALVEIFEWEFDFTADTRRGDRFRLLVEKRYAGGTFVNYGRVLVAQYESSDRILTAVGFAAGRRGAVAYYDLDGRSLRKMFLKSPLEYTRITSGFTYARPHPVLGGVRPHLAIDYAAPVGTPVRAVADGLVVRAGWDGGSGISVRLRHRRGYGTMYNHLSKLGPGIGRGVRVRQRQVIGYVGSTGLSTGPHLDYRVDRGGVFVNPLNETFVPGEPIPRSRRAEFQRHADALVERLERDAPF